MRTHRYAAVVAALLLGACGDTQIDITDPDPDPFGDGPIVTAEDFEWRGVMTPGHELEVKGIAGDIHVTQADGTEAIVLAEKRGTRFDVRRVRIDVLRTANGVTICAVYPTRAGDRPNTCRPNTGGTQSTHDNDVRVTFHVMVPEGIDFAGRTIAGDVDVDGIADDALGYSVAGNVTLRVGGVAEGGSIAGSVRAVMGGTDWGRDLELATVAGNVSVEVPADVDTEVEASALNGRFFSDFPIDRDGIGRWAGRIGSGGPRLTLSSLSGDITLTAGGPR